MDREKKEKKEENAPQEAPAAEEPLEGSAAEAQDKAPETDPKEEEIARLRAESADFKRKWYLVTAEYDNYRKRTAQTRAGAYAEGRADVVAKIFPIADNLERALASCADEGTKKGISMVLSSFENLLKEEKIETIDPVGQPFDAGESEAIAAVDPAEGETSGTVRQVYRKGYRQNGKVLRFAQVVVVK